VVCLPALMEEMVMDERQFDALLRRVARAPTRRQMLQRLGIGIGAVALPLLHWEAAQAGCRRCCKKLRRTCKQRCAEFPVAVFECQCNEPGATPKCLEADCVCDAS
jgi:hypothetical protein